MKKSLIILYVIVAMLLTTLFIYTGQSRTNPYDDTELDDIQKLRLEIQELKINEYLLKYAQDMTAQAGANGEELWRLQERYNIC